jgi:uncharacterized metal-binding protein
MADCSCSNGVRLFYACSGAADVGAIADQVVRKLLKDGYGKPTCLAAVGAHLPAYIESAKGAGENIAIDGCAVGCAKTILEHIGITPKSYILTEMGLEKGKTPPEEKTIQKIVETIQSEL